MSEFSLEERAQMITSSLVWGGAKNTDARLPSHIERAH